MCSSVRTYSFPLQKKMARQLVWLLLHLLLLPIVASAVVPPSSSTSSQNDIVKPGCQSACGKVSVPYPFGIGDGCFLNESFSITCRNNIPYLGDSNITLVDISLTDGLLVVNNHIAYDCYDGDVSNNTVQYSSMILNDLPNYKFSHVRNKFIAVGCDTYGYIDVQEHGSRFWAGCSLFCNSSSDVPDDGTCSGIGCCSAPIPKDLRSISISLGTYNNHTYCRDFNLCGFAFVTDEAHFKFNRSSLTELRKVTNIPLTLDWAIMGENCEQSQQGNNSAYACVSRNSYCLNSTNGPGYLCKCSEGFDGNPYLTDGCKDTNECDAAESPCFRKRRCKNLPGGYSCSCPWHMYGDGEIHGSGCRSIFKIIYAVLAGGFGLFVAISIVSWVCYALKKKRMMELKEKFFRQNGGLLLREQHNSVESGRSSATKLFSLEELQAATDNYKPSRILGEGGAGTVYRGVLPDQSVVAIKKAKVPSELEVEQFINEVNILSHINHRNVVRLLGCCLEDQVPMLVYEFVPNGTLSHHIHGEDGRGSLSLDHRLRIAAEVAGALFYLHSAASVPIIHRDVKSTNILLDDNLTAKVSDFGASRLVPLDQNGLVSLVRGTFGYLDPEYLTSGQFTDKSDVYSFGVVLVELLTGENPVDKSLPVERRYLAAHFTTSVDGGRLFEVLEGRVREEGTPELLVAAAELAKRCLSVKGENRPSMREVAMELEGLRKLAGVHPWVEEVHPEEAEHLLQQGDRSSANGPGFEDQYDFSSHGVEPSDIMR